MSTCAVCGADGRRFLIAGYERFKHHRTADHQFLPAPKRESETPAPRREGSVPHTAASRALPSASALGGAIQGLDAE